MAQAFRFRCEIKKTCFQLEVIPSGNYSGQGVNETGFSSGTSVHTCHDSDEEPTTYHRKRLGSNPGKSICVFCC